MQMLCYVRLSRPFNLFLIRLYVFSPPHKRKKKENSHKSYLRQPLNVEIYLCTRAAWHVYFSLVSTSKLMPGGYVNFALKKSVPWHVCNYILQHMFFATVSVLRMSWHKKCPLCVWFAFNIHHRKKPCLFRLIFYSVFRHPLRALRLFQITALNIKQISTSKIFISFICKQCLDAKSILYHLLSGYMSIKTASFD